MIVWSGLIIVILAGIAAASGHVSPMGFGLGLGLLALWYFFERETPIGPATREELDALTDALHESSTEFDLPDFPEFLKRIAPHIQSGFGSRVIARLTSIATALPHNRESQSDLQVVFCGTSTPLKVGFFKDDLSTITVYFFTSGPLAEFLTEEMTAFFDERGM